MTLTEKLICMTCKLRIKLNWEIDGWGGQICQLTSTSVSAASQCNVKLINSSSIFLFYSLPSHQPVFESAYFDGIAKKTVIARPSIWVLGRRSHVNWEHHVHKSPSVIDVISVYTYTFRNQDSVPCLRAKMIFPLENHIFLLCFSSNSSIPLVPQS